MLASAGWNYGVQTSWCSGTMAAVEVMPARVQDGNRLHDGSRIVGQQAGESQQYA